MRQPTGVGLIVVTARLMGTGDTDEAALRAGAWKGVEARPGGWVVGKLAGEACGSQSSGG